MEVAAIQVVQVVYVYVHQVSADNSVIHKLNHQVKSIYYTLKLLNLMNSIDPCLPMNPCLNNAQCMPDGMGGFRCICPQGLTGQRCEQSNKLPAIDLFDITSKTNFLFQDYHVQATLAKMVVTV
jgi:hypothetical protein